MKISEVCINRPVLASVMSLVIALFGLISLTRLQNRELPAIDPPIVSVTTVFPGAAPEVVETSVTDPLEDQVMLARQPVEFLPKLDILDWLHTRSRFPSPTVGLPARGPVPEPFFNIGAVGHDFDCGASL